MKKLFIAALLGLMLLVGLAGCISVSLSPVFGVTGTGDPEVFEFNVGDYSEIRIDLYCNVNYRSTPSDIVTLQIQPNLREYISIEESNGVLIVTSTRGFNINWPSNTPVLTVSTPNLKRLTLNGAGSFTTYDKIEVDSFSLILNGAGRSRVDLDVNNLYVDMSGAGEYEFSGSADYADFDLSGAGSIEALPMETRETKIKLSGAGTIKLNCTENLQITASGVGNIEYKGNPRVDLNQNGVVSIKKID